MATTLRLLIVDDSAIYRKLLSQIAEQIPDLEVVGQAKDGYEAFDKIQQLNPDLMTLDVEMPGLDGIQTLKKIKEKQLTIGVIMVSAHTTSSAKLTIEALELGAFDFIAKPEGGSLEKNQSLLRSDLKNKIDLFRINRTKMLLKRIGTIPVRPSTAGLPTAPSSQKTAVKSVIRSTKTRLVSKKAIVAIGISTGGPNALSKMLPEIPKNIGVPILIVQHMPPLFTKQLADNLNSKCEITVVEASEGLEVVPGTAYIAPGGKHMTIEEKLIQNQQKKVIALNENPPENNCRPAVDVLFRSVHQLYQNNCVGVIMTGMGHDGTIEMRQMRQKNAYLIAQDEKSCVVFGMPSKPIQENLVDCVASLDQIANEIMQVVPVK